MSNNEHLNNALFRLATKFESDDLTVDIYAVNADWGLTDDILSTILQKFKLKITSKDDSTIFESIRIASAVANGTIFGLPRYTCTLALATDGANPTMRGLANSDSGTNVVANRIESRVISEFPADSPCGIHVGHAEFQELQDAFDSNVANRFLQTSDFDSATGVSVGDDRGRWTIPSKFNGDDLTIANASVDFPGLTGDTTIQLARGRMESALGDSTTQFDISDEGGDTFKYLYDGTGTDPVIADSDASLRIGDRVNIQAQNFTAANNGWFTITAVGANYFEVTNASGVAESDKTLGTGSLTPFKWRDMLSTPITISSEGIDGAGVIDVDFDDIETGDRIRRDIDTVSTTPPKGLTINVEFTS